MSAYSEVYKGYTIKVEQDEDPINPRRDYDNAATMVCFHGKYDLGDDVKQHNRTDPDAFRAWLTQHKKDVISLPLYLIDHSGISMNTGGYGACDPQGWDWGCVGVIYITKTKAREWWSWKVLTKKRHEMIVECLKAEVQEYDYYLTGAVYYYTIKDPQGEDVDSCSGYFGYPEDNGMLPDARAQINCQIEDERKKHTVKRKAEIKHRAPLYVRQALPAGAVG